MLGDLFTGIAQGYMGERMKAQEAQLKSDAESKQQYISLLGSMMDQVEPESRPLLLSHIGDLMGMKGKEKGLWDTLTGKSQYDLQNQLGAKFKEAMGSLSGPQQYRKDQQAQTVESLFTPTTPEQTQNHQQRQQARQGRIYMRDPRQEKMEEFERQKAYQDRLTQDQIRLREEERRQTIADTEKQKQDYRDQAMARAVHDTAQLLATQRLGAKGPVADQFITEEDMKKAIQMHLDRENIPIEEKRRRAELIQANIKDMTGGAMGLGVDIFGNPTTAPGAFRAKKDIKTAGDAAERGIRKQQLGLQQAALGMKQEAERRKAREKYNMSLSAVNAATTEVFSLLQAKGKNPVMSKGGTIMIKTPDGKTRLPTPSDVYIGGMDIGKSGEKIANYLKLRGEFAAATESAKTLGVLPEKTEKKKK